jgi:hypothetical protein
MTVKITRQSLARLTGERRVEERHRLADRLLAIAGKSVLWQGPDPHDSDLIERGRLFSQHRRLRLGWPNDCHGNASRTWQNHPAWNALVTGYALSQGAWRRHSWVVAGNVLRETTAISELYFGVELTEEEALLFWERSVGHDDYWDKTSLPPRIAALLDRCPVAHARLRARFRSERQNDRRAD